MEYIRFFQLDGEWCTVHVPYRPSGFAILILGDKNHFVDEKTSFWIQNTGRSQILSYLLSEGYTIFYSNLYGRNWGNHKAVSLAKRLYHIMMKQEILNDKIHILSEGMGSILALHLMNDLSCSIRSIAMMNPCIDLKRFIEDEKENKFFYKRLIRDLCFAYEIQYQPNYSKIVDSIPELSLSNTKPVAIWQTTTNSTYNPMRHSRYYEEYRKTIESPISLKYYLSEKRFGIGPSIYKFYKEYEKEL